MELRKQLDFIAEIEKLKDVTRQNKTLAGRFENSAEHSWHLAIVSMVLGKDLYPEANQARIVELLLVHDLAEVYAGDTHLYDDAARTAASAQEELAAAKLFGLLPEGQASYFSELRREFEAGLTQESRIAKALDGFQPLLNHLRTCPEGENVHQLKKSQVLQKKAFIQDVLPELWPYVLEIIDESVKRGLYFDE